MRPRSEHPYYSKYGGASEVPGPALPRSTLPSHLALVGSRDASHTLSAARIAQLEAVDGWSWSIGRGR